MTDTKFDKFSFDTDFFEISVGAAVGAANQTPQNKEEAAYLKGVEEGKTQAEADFAQQTHNHLDMLQTTALKMEKEQKEAFLKLQNKLLGLTLNALNKIIANASENFPQDILSKHLSETIQQLEGDHEFVLRIHPDAVTFHEKLGGDKAVISHKKFKIKTDETLQKTDCIVEWNSGGVEATLHNAQEKLMDRFLAAGAEPLKDPKTPTEPQKEDIVETVPEPEIQEEPLA